MMEFCSRLIIIIVMIIANHRFFYLMLQNYRYGGVERSEGANFPL